VVGQERVTWELSDRATENGWQILSQEALDSGGRLSHTFLRGHYTVRARIEDIASGKVVTTAPLEVVAYHVPEFTIAAPHTVMRRPGEPATAVFAAVTAEDAPLVWEWSTDDGQTWQGGQDRFPYTYDPPLPDAEYAIVDIVARARYANAPPDDPHAWSIAKATTRFAPLLAPFVQLTGPDQVELGLPQHYRGTVFPPYRSLAPMVLGEFILPDGTRVPGDEMTYTPTKADLVDNRINVTYRGTFEGIGSHVPFSEQTLSSRSVRYQWPTWMLYGVPRSRHAPSTIQLYARQEQTQLPIDTPVFRWEMPEEAQLVEDTAPDRRLVRLERPGTYRFAYTVSDSRGNESLAVYSVVLSAHSPANEATGIKAAFSPGLDKVSPSDASTDQNLTPSCAIERTDFRSSWMYTAQCRDPDGKLADFRWTVDGHDMSAAGRLTLSKAKYPNEPTVTLQVEDDAGALSPIVSP
jgi:hypothetical protein